MNESSAPSGFCRAEGCTCVLHQVADAQQAELEHLRSVLRAWIKKWSPALAPRPVEEIEEAVRWNETVPKPSVPHDRFQVELHISGATWPDLMSELTYFFREIRTHGPECKLVSGGPSHGGWVKITEDPTMTPERHSKELSEYVEWMKAHPEEDDGD